MFCVIRIRDDGSDALTDIEPAREDCTEESTVQQVDRHDGGSDPTQSDDSSNRSDEGDNPASGCTEAYNEYGEEDRRDDAFTMLAKDLVFLLFHDGVLRQRVKEKW